MPLPLDAHTSSATAPSMTPTRPNGSTSDLEVPPGAPTSTTTSNNDVYTQTRDSLRLASTALDAAYTRLRELRIAIRGLSAASDGMNPGHAAIVLPGGNSATAENATADSSQGETEPLRIPSLSSVSRDIVREPLSSNPTSLFHLPELPPLEPARSPGPSPIASTDSSNPGGQGRLRQLRSRRSLLEDHLRIRREDMVGAIGRRAAARAAAEAVSATGSRTEDTQSLYDRSIQIANELEQTIDRYLANRRSLSNALATAQRTIAPARPDEASRSQRNNATTEGTGLLNSTEQTTSPRSRVLPAPRRVASHTPRFSLGLRALDVFQRHHPNSTDSLHNPSLGIPFPSSERSLRDSTDSLDDLAPGRPSERSFRDSDAGTMEDLEDAMSRMMRPGDDYRFLPSNRDSVRQPLRARDTTSSLDWAPDRDHPFTAALPSRTGRRRWALLDEDGDEIASTPRDITDHMRSENSLIPTTQTSIFHDSDDEIRIARVRLNNHRLQLVLDMNSDPTAAAQHPITFGSPIPYRVDPLPVPIERMMRPSPARVKATGKERRIVTRKPSLTTGIGR
ncbi:hypothetical protein OE88DRAFT_1651413 [Heliocybe sulcata]|uniref:Uncharacterized protein n=1 Tax=Heliocybe sulcata TaxID=5364 RepID=A0A5C3NMA9_9AGAM|nr:hypothetical protein OE88DRAFT_1651413 [Heliocybe sulcata]